MATVVGESHLISRHRLPQCESYKQTELDRATSVIA